MICDLGDADLAAAHRYTCRHGQDLRLSTTCGCFSCCAVFGRNEIVDWIDADETALGPRCRIDGVIGDRSGYPVADAVFLQKMHNKWFGN